MLTDFPLSIKFLDLDVSRDYDITNVWDYVTITVDLTDKQIARLCLFCERATDETIRTKNPKNNVLKTCIGNSPIKKIG